MVLPGNNISHSEIVQQVSHQLSTSPHYSLPPGWLSVREDGPGPGRGGVQAGVRALLLQWRHRHTVNVCLALNFFQPDPRTETNLLLSPLNLFCSYSDNKWYFHSELYCWPSKTSRYYLALASEERLSQTVSDKALKDNLLMRKLSGGCNKFWLSQYSNKEIVELQTHPQSLFWKLRNGW